MTVYFVSDLHLGHRNIHKYRNQFATSEDHDRYVAERVLEAGGKRNILWLLGDCFFTTDSLKWLREISSRFQSVHWILGNHDVQCAETRNNVTVALREGLVVSVGGVVKYKEFWLSHAPIHPDELRGKKNIHGHMHDRTLDSDDYISVCLEQIDYRPKSLTEIRKDINEHARAV